jgi:hypothetical protein
LDNHCSLAFGERGRGRLGRLGRGKGKGKGQRVGRLRRVKGKGVGRLRRVKGDWGRGRLGIGREKGGGGWKGEK